MGLQILCVTRPPYQFYRSKSILKAQPYTISPFLISSTLTPVIFYRSPTSPNYLIIFPSYRKDTIIHFQRQALNTLPYNMYETYIFAQYGMSCPMNFPIMLFSHESMVCSVIINISNRLNTSL